MTTIAGTDGFSAALATGLAAVRALPCVASANGAGTEWVVELQATSPEQSRLDAATVVGTLVGTGARVAAVIPAGNPLEEAWMQLQRQAREEGLIG